jgi:TatD DNase family protein
MHISASLTETRLERSCSAAQLRVSLSHQMALTELHLGLAAELHRPVSMHCVRAYGETQNKSRGVCLP